MSTPMATGIGFTVAMLIALVLSVTAGSGKSETSRRRTAGGPLTVLGGASVYLILLLSVFTNSGITLLPLLVLAVAVILPAIVARATAAPRLAMSAEGRTLFDSVGVLVAFALLVGQLAVAGAVLSLFGGVNRILATAGFGLCCAAYVVASGRTGSIRTSRYAVVTLVLAVVVLIVGVVLGSPATLVAPLVPALPLEPGVAVAALLAVVAVGAFDPNLRMTLAHVRCPRALRVGVVLAALTTLFLGIGGMLFFGGVLQAPNLEIMTLFAVIPAMGIVVMMLVVTFVLASNVDSLLSAGADALVDQSEDTGEDVTDRPAQARNATIALATIGVIAAILVPNPLLFLGMAALVAAAGAGALARSCCRSVSSGTPWAGFIAGIAAAIIASIFLGPGDVASVGGETALMMAVAVVVSAAVSLAVGNKGQAVPGGDSP